MRRNRIVFYVSRLPLTKKITKNIFQKMSSEDALWIDNESSRKSAWKCLKVGHPKDTHTANVWWVAYERIHFANRVLGEQAWLIYQELIKLQFILSLMHRNCFNKSNIQRIFICLILDVRNVRERGKNSFITNLSVFKLLKFMCNGLRESLESVFNPGKIKYKA